MMHLRLLTAVRALVSLALVGCAVPAAASGPTSASITACAGTDVRAMTYNIRLDTPSDGENSWAHRRDWLTSQISWLRPDIFGLQEVVFNQKQDIISTLPGYQIIGYGRDDGRDAGESSPIGFAAERFQLIASGTFWLSPTPDTPGRAWDAAYPRIATWVRIRSRTGGTTILAVNTHWDHVGTEARRQSGIQLRQWLGSAARPGEHLVLLGDFNSDIDSEAMRTLLDPAPGGATFRDSRTLSSTAPFGPRGTFNGFRLEPDAAPAIDHILVGDSVTVERHAVIAQNIAGRMISDHYPVLADLHLGPPCPPAILPGHQIAIPATATTYPYLLYVPASYRGNERPRFPLLIFLHGSGERGSDIALVRTHGPPRDAANRPDYPFITLSPQLEAGGDWSVAKLDATLAAARRTVTIDPSRIYLTGLSLGGHGTWRWAAARPHLFAAIAPIAGRGDTARACALRRLPVWAFHGADDAVVPASGSSAMAEAITACGGQRARLTLYPATGHDSWTRTYADPLFTAWLLAQHR